MGEGLQEGDQEESSEVRTPHVPDVAPCGRGTCTWEVLLGL